MDWAGRDLPSPMGYGPPSSSSFRPQFSGGWSRSVPLSQPSLSSNPIRRLERVDPVQKITRPEEETYPGEKADQHIAVAKKFDSPFDEACSFLEHCRSFRRPSRHHVPSPWDDYNLERPLRIKMPMKDWAKLGSELGGDEA